MVRAASVKRRTNETDVEVNVTLEGNGSFEGGTGIRFLDHVLQLITHHALFDLQIRASWDLVHHGVEDVATTLGQAIGKALGEREGIRRFGFAVIPMDEALAEASVDLVKRAHSSVNLQMLDSSIEDVKREDLIHFFRSLAESIPAVVHINVRYGENEHHKVEAAVKALAIALRSACSIDPRRKGPPSSKGAM